MLPRSDHDEQARQGICRALRAHLLNEVQPATRTVFETRVEPAFEATHGRAPADRHEVREEMSRDPLYRLYCASLRSTQELMWDAVIDSVERDTGRLREVAAESRSAPRGTLVLDPELVVPDYHTAADIHLQPGGYHADSGDDDIAAGAIYDRTVFIYGDGKYGVYNELMGTTAIDTIRALRPDWAPARILEMGCTAGNSILPYCDAWPDAEIQGVDVGAACLRYAHARAEALGKTVHFRQANAEATGYESSSFDLIVSHLLFHETGRSAFGNILRECHRLLAPGGLMVHLDIPQERHCDDLYESFMWDWEAYNNNETFEVVLRDLDYEKAAIEAGFDDDRVEIRRAPFGWPILFGEIAPREQVT